MVNKIFFLWDQPTKVSLCFILLLLLIESFILKRQKKSLKFSLALPFGTLLVCLLIVGLGRDWLSKRHFSAAQDFAKKNSGEETVREIKRAVYFNPLNDTYHLSLAQASLALANQEARKTSPDQEKIEQLIKETIEEGKKATLIAPKKVQNWLGLGNIYRFLSSVSGAEDWAIKCYKKALEIEPENGQIYELLAGVYLAQGKIEEAKTELKTALSLSEANSPVFQRIQNTLEKLE